MNTNRFFSILFFAEEEKNEFFAISRSCVGDCQADHDVRLVKGNFNLEVFRDPILLKIGLKRTKLVL
jgi:hypothetical protein